MGRLGGVWAADAAALWLGDLLEMEPSLALVVLSGSGWRLWPMSRMEDRAMSEVVCSECGVGAGEAARPRWPLWLRWLPWLAVAMVVAVAVVWGVLGSRTTQRMSVNDVLVPFTLTEWNWTRVQNASVDPAEAMLLRAEVLAIADRYGDLIEPGATLHFGWDQGRGIPVMTREQYGWPAIWAAVVRTASGQQMPFSRTDWRGSQIMMIRPEASYMLSLLGIAAIVAFSMGLAWACTWCTTRLCRARGRTMARRWSAAVFIALFVMTMGVLLSVPTEPFGRDSWGFGGSSSLSAGTAEMSLESIRRAEGDGEFGIRTTAAMVRTPQPAVSPPFTEPPNLLAVDWVNPTEATVSTTEFGEPWSSIGFGSTQFERPADGITSTRIAWPRWKWGGLHIYAGTRGFPSNAGFVVLEPGGLGAWTLVAVVVFWIAAGVRGLVQRRVIRRRELAGQCLTCGYAMGGGAG